MEDLNDKVTGNKLTAAEFVQPMSELQNVIEGTGQTLTDLDLNQLGNGIAEYVANGAFYTDSGSVNTHVLSQVGSKQAPKAYVDGMSVEFISITANTGAATVDVASLGAKTIIDTSLAGKISVGVRYSLRYRLGSDDFEIITAKSTASQQEIQSITASVASNALTVGLNKTALYFRSSSLTDGLPTLINITTALSLVVPSTATLGTINGKASRLILLAINNAGTVELAIINQSGGNDLSETGLISTIVLDALSTNNNIAYSAVARNNVAYRVVGFIDSTQTTAGTWATAPDKVQGAGGNALTSMGSLGYGQTWQDLTASRASGVTYYNTTGKPITIMPSFTSLTTLVVTVNGVTIWPATIASIAGVTFIVPPDSSYSVTQANGITSWMELR